MTSHRNPKALKKHANMILFRWWHTCFDVLHLWANWSENWWVWVHRPKSAGRSIERGWIDDWNRCRYGWRSRDGNSLTRLQSQLFAASDQSLQRYDWFGSQLNVDDSLIMLFEWPQGFAEKIERRYGIPRRIELAQKSLRAIAISDNFDAPGAVVSEVRRDRSLTSDRLLVDVNIRARRIGPNGHPFSNATGKSHNDNYKSHRHRAFCH